MLTQVARKVFVALNSAGHTVIDSWWESSSEGEEITSKDVVDEHIHDDNEKEQWVGEFTVKDASHERVQGLIESVYGKPTRVHELPERKVNNWDVKGVTIVHVGDNIEFFEPYKKVSRRK